MKQCGVTNALNGLDRMLIGYKKKNLKAKKTRNKFCPEESNFEEEIGTCVIDDDS